MAAQVEDRKDTFAVSSSRIAMLMNRNVIALFNSAFLADLDECEMSFLSTCEGEASVCNNLPGTYECVCADGK